MMVWRLPESRRPVQENGVELTRSLISSRHLCLTDPDTGKVRFLEIRVEEVILIVPGDVEFYTPAPGHEPAGEAT